MNRARPQGPELLAPPPAAGTSLARAGLLLGAGMGAANALNYAYNLAMVRPLATVLALAELVLFSGIAAGDRRYSRLLLAAALAEGALIQLVLHRSVGQILGVALGTAAALLAAGWALERRVPRPVPAP